MPQAPLAGVTVVEAASFISGPFAAMTLADLGAEVTKVEPPRGDPYRRFGDMHGDASLLFRAANQNKRSIVLDLKTDGGLTDFHQLLATADVLITNWRPNAAARIGLEAEAVRAKHPQLIWVRITGFGVDGPMANLPAFDSVIQARSGVMRSGSDTPVIANNLVADKVTSMSAVQTALAALHVRSETGVGAVCDVAMMDAMAYFNGVDASAGHRRVGADADSSVAEMVYRDTTLPTADSWILIVPVTGAQLRAALEATGNADGWDSIRSAGPENIWDRFVDMVLPALSEKTTEEWEAIFAHHDVPATAILTFDEHLTDPQTIHNETYEVVDDPDLGRYRRPRHPARFNGEAIRTAGAPSPRQP